MSTKEPVVRYLRLIGRLRPDNRLVLMPGYLTEDAREASDDKGSDLVAELHDDSGKLLLRYGVPLLEYRDGGKNCNDLAVRGNIPFPLSTRVVRLLRRGIPIHEIKVSPAAPVITLEWQPKKNVAGRETVTWKASHGEGLPMQYFLRYSHDGGRKWRRISSRLENPTHTIDAAQLPGGSRCAIAVVATDGVNTTIAQSGFFAVDIKPCAAHILGPLNTAVVPAGTPICFNGQGYYLEENTPELEHLSWESSLDGKLGNGPIVMTSSLKPGRHRITLSAGQGKRIGRAVISLTVQRSQEAS